MAKKKVAKKVVRRAKPEASSEQEEVLMEAIDELSEEEIDEIIESPSYPKPATVGVADSGNNKKGPEYDKVKVRLPVALKIKGKRYSPGVHTFEKHQVPTILEMIGKKRKADLSVFTGNTYMIERLLDRTLIIKDQGGELDLKKMTN